MLTITPVYAAIHILLAVALMYLVVHHRLGKRVSVGDGGHDDLVRAIRAHGNLAENAPFVLLLMALVEWNGLPTWQLHVIGGVFTLARLSHAYGLINATLAPRSLGALTTSIVMMVLAGVALIQAMA